MVWLLALLFTFGCYVLLGKLVNVSHDANEPPLIPQGVPFVGHLLGLLQNGSHYYTKIQSVKSKENDVNTCS